MLKFSQWTLLLWMNKNTLRIDDLSLSLSMKKNYWFVSFLCNKVQKWKKSFIFSITSENVSHFDKITEFSECNINQVKEYHSHGVRLLVVFGFIHASKHFYVLAKWTKFFCEWCLIMKV